MGRSQSVLKHMKSKTGVNFQRAFNHAKVILVCNNGFL